MAYIKIGINSDSAALLDIIKKNLKKISDNKCLFHEYELDGFAFVVCSFEASHEMLKVKVSGLLTDLIIEKYEKIFTLKLVRSNYDYFTRDEQKEICEYIDEAWEEESSSPEGIFNRNKRHNLVFKQFSDYFENWDTIIIDGFINFRLKDYMKALEGFIEECVTKYIGNREHREFLDLLRYFINIQDPMIETVHITPKSDGEYTIFDEQGNDILKTYFSDFKNEYSDLEPETANDMLISVLITMVPEYIEIHDADFMTHKEIYDTILYIFGERCKIVSY